MQATSRFRPQIGRNRRRKDFAYSGPMVKAFWRELMKVSMNIIVKATVICTVLTLSLAGCVSKPLTGAAPSIALSDLSELPSPQGVSAYIVGKQEQLEITVVGADLLSGTFLTDADGYLAYPLIGDVFVAGKTPNQVARMLADRLRGDYVLDPQVRVRPQEAVIPAISVGGQVTKPGNYAAAASPTLLRAINNAGGLADYAKKDDVLVLRTVEDRRYIGVYNIQAIQRGNYADPLLYPGDVVTVGDSPGRRRLDAVIQFVPLLSSAAILFERAFN